MRRVLLIVGLSAGLLSAPLTGAFSQSGEPDTGAASGHYFGVGYASESLPNAVDPICGRAAGRRGGSVLGAFLFVPIFAAVSVEGRVSYHARPGEMGCMGSERLNRDETLTLSSVDVGAGDFPTMDLRLRLAAGPRSWWVAAVGAGWAGSTKDLPYVVSSAGLRGGSRVRWGIDLELASYRVPWTEETAVYQVGQPVNVIATRSHNAWESSFGGRFVLEIPVTRR